MAQYLRQLGMLSMRGIMGEREFECCQRLADN